MFLSEDICLSHDNDRRTSWVILIYREMHVYCWWLLWGSSKALWLGGWKLRPSSSLLRPTMPTLGPIHGLISYIYTKAQCRHLKKIYLYWDLRQVLIWPLSFYDPIPPSPYTLYTCILYACSHSEGGRGGELTRVKVRGVTVQKAGSKIPTWLTV